MTLRTLLVAFVALLVASVGVEMVLPSTNHAQAQSDFGFGEKSNAEAVKPSLLADTTAVAAGKPFTVGVRFEIAEGWDIYWRFVGDLGLPTQVEWELPEGFRAGPLQWPLPEAFLAKGDIMNYVYHHEALLMAEITPPAGLPPGPVTIKAKLKWQQCNDAECIPMDAAVKLTLEPGVPQPANAESFANWRAQLPNSGEPPLKVRWELGKDQLTLRVSGAAPEAKLEFFPLPPDGAKAERAKVGTPDADGMRKITVPIDGELPAGATWQGLLTMQPPNAPRAGWMIAAPAGTVASPDVAKATAGPKPAAPSAPSAETRSAVGWLWAAFLGGLILNLMPCVLPVISLKIFGFINQAGENPRRVFQLGLAFCAGVVAFFLGLAVLLVGLRSVGRDFIWGAQFGDPRLLITVIALVVIFAMSMFGVFEITLGGVAENQIGALVRRDGFAGAFVHGLFTTLLGTSCTAPIVGSVLGSALTQPAPMVFGIFATMAVGMSFPYLLLTSNPAWMRYLPKPGVWMERLKQFTGFILLALAVWLLGSLGHINGAEAMGAAGWFLVILSLACWVFGVMGRGWKAVLVAAVIAAIGGKFFIPTALEKHVTGEGQSETTSVGNVWEPFTEDRLAAAVAANQPVFVDFTASWCPNCIANEKTVLNTKTIAEAFKAKGVLLLKADCSDYPPSLVAWLKRYQKAGVPMYLLYTPGEAEPYVFPERLTKQIVLDRLNPIGV